MKKLILGLLSICLVVGTVTAQEGKKALKKASKEIAKYNADSAANADALSSAMSLVATALEDAEVAADPKTYNTIGKIYNDVVDGEWKASLLDSLAEITSVDAAMKGADAYAKALAMAEKNGTKKDALAGLAVSEALLNNVGVKYFDKQDYGGAFDYFNKAIEVYKLINANGGASRLDDDTSREEHYYVTAASGYYGDRKADSKPVFMELFNQGAEKALVYEALFNIGLESGEPDAVKYLEKGRELFPEDSGILFAEINYYLKEGRLDDLTGKLKAAIEKEPTNSSLYITLGSVYDQLTQKERAAGNIEKADEYFALALDYYDQTLQKDPTNFDAVYSQGALYYNKAAGMTDMINELSNDFSAAGTKKYDALKVEMDGYFKEALPYFEKADAMATEAGTTDLNTLIALREIYARTNQLEKVGPLKARIEATQAGN